MKAAVVVLCLAVLGAAVAQNPNCDPSYECVYRYVDPQNQDVYQFDLSSLCASSDYVLQDSVRHTYYANICGNAKQNCLPATWTNTYEYGVAVQMWGATPSCSPPSCTDKQNNNVCCTANCQVLGTGQPYWSVLDATNPQTGGIMARFLGAAPSDSDPYWCPFNPATGAQSEREVHMIFNCDSSVSGVNTVGASQNATNDCHYSLTFATSKACAGGGISGGWIAVIVLVVLFAVYAIAGTAYNFATTGRLEFPNKAFWTALPGNVLAGFSFVGRGCRKAGGPVAGSSYAEIDPHAGATYSSSTYHAGGDKDAREPYTDL